MTTEKRFMLRVAVALPVGEPFYYTVPADLLSEARVGCRVLVPFGKSRTTGYILERVPLSEERELKDIYQVLDSEPLYPPNMVAFFQWMADYYLHPLGRLIQSALPGGLNMRAFVTARLTEEGEAFLRSPRGTRKEKELLSWIEEHPGKRVPVPAHELHVLRKKGLLLLEHKTAKARTGPLLRRFVTAKEGICLDSLLRDDAGSEKDRQFLKEVFSAKAIPLTDVCCRYSNGAYLVRKWVKKGLVECCKETVVRDPAGNILSSMPPPERLCAQQEEVLSAIRGGLQKKSFTTCLLYGVTGSGKTEVYYQAIQEAVRIGRQAILMVPEIALVIYMEGLFRSRLGDRVAVYHSGLSEGERYDQWMRMAGGKVDLVIGARSALFAPFPDTGLIILDEEHDASYKQEESPRYQARDAAVVRGKIDKAFVLLGSGTPSIQSFYNALQGRYELLSMPERIEKRPLPEVELVDMKSLPAAKGDEEIVSPNLRQALDDALAEGNQSMLFLNRRGFNRIFLCRFCGYSHRCANCDLALIYHLRENRLVCHYCGFQQEAAVTCPSCGREGLRPYGFGTERVEKVLGELYPGIRTARMDRDSMRRKGETFQLLKKFSRREMDVLIGTQMITKGYDFPHVTLVGVLAADFSLDFPDFRAAEKTFQLLSQVAGRAGRGEQRGKVIIQTFYPEHYAIAAAKHHDYQKFFEQEMELRRQLWYPPFSFLACLRLQGNNAQKTADLSRHLCEDMSRTTAKWPKQGKDIQILGPVEAPLAKLRGKYRWQIFVKSRKSALLHHFMEQVGTSAKRMLRGTGVSLAVDVDPYQML